MFPGRLSPSNSVTRASQPNPDDQFTGVRTLGAADVVELLTLLDRDVDAYAVVAERVVPVSLDPHHSGGPTWGWFKDGSLRSAAFVGPNVILIETTPEARSAFAGRLAAQGRRASAIVGFRDEVLDLWRHLESAWGSAREVRADQPLLVMADDPESQSVGDLRRLRVDELDIVMPAAIDMFTHEVGVSPVADGRGPGYRARLMSALSRGRVYGVVEQGAVVFKAEVGAVGRGSAQVQGVWLAPESRGSGLAAPLMAAVVAAVRRDHAPRVNLYANSHNTAAINLYQRVGFHQVGTFATVLF